MARGQRQRRGFGWIRPLPSGRYQASYIGPDNMRHKAETTFSTRLDAEAWLARRRNEVVDGVWSPGRITARPTPTVSEYASTWLARRNLKPTTRAHYDGIMDRFILPELGAMRLRDVTPEHVAEWHHGLRAQTGDVMRAHAYSLLRSIFLDAQKNDLVTASPCRVFGAGRSPRPQRRDMITLPELAEVIHALPDNLQMMAELTAWTALRFGEVAELRRKDLDMRRGVIHVRRGVTRPHGGEVVVGPPKTESSKRDVTIPPHVLPNLATHLERHAQHGRDGLVFPGPSGGHWTPSGLYYHWHRARAVIGREDLRWHDLRHVGGTLAAQSGATLRELMDRLGHSTPAAALRYQEAARDSDRRIAEKLSQLAQEGRN